jgi:hypothetical protein
VSCQLHVPAALTPVNYISCKLNITLLRIELLVSAIEFLHPQGKKNIITSVDVVSPGARDRGSIKSKRLKTEI